MERLFTILEQHNIILDVLYDYENESKLLYDFITLEFLNHETNDISIPGMMSHFIYEEFHPNHYEDLKKDSIEFWNKYFANNSERFDEFTLGDLVNSDEFISFRDSFEKFDEIEINVLEVHFNLENNTGTTKVKLNFEAQIDKQNKVVFDCESTMNFIFEHEFWYLREAEIPS